MRKRGPSSALSSTSSSSFSFGLATPGPAFYNPMVGNAAFMHQTDESVTLVARHSMQNLVCVPLPRIASLRKRWSGSSPKHFSSLLLKQPKRRRLPK